MLKATYHPSATQRLTVSISNCRNVNINGTWNTGEFFRSEPFLDRPRTLLQSQFTSCIRMKFSIPTVSGHSYPQNSENNRKTSEPMCFLFFLTVMWVYGKAIFYCRAAFYQTGFFLGGRFINSSTQWCSRDLCEVPKSLPESTLMVID